MQILFLLDFCQQYLTYSILTLYYLLHLSSSACLAAPTSLWPYSFLFNPLKPMTRTCSSFFCVLLFFCKSCIYNKKTCSILVHAANLPKVMCLFEATLTAMYYKTLLQLTYWSWNKHFNVSCLHFIPSKLTDHELLKLT